MTMATKRTTEKTPPRRAEKASSKKRIGSAAPGRAAAADATILQHLGAEEARRVLLELVGRHPDLSSEVTDLVEKMLGTTSFEWVADDVLEEIVNLEVFDMSNRSGGQPWGYVDPSEAAEEMVREVIEPFIDRIASCAAMGFHDAALELCRGVLLGLYRAERCDASDIVAWMGGGLSVLAQAAIDALRPVRRRKDAVTPRPLPEELARFAKEHLPEWGWLQR